jgi:hypothetical protein
MGGIQFNISKLKSITPQTLVNVHDSQESLQISSSDGVPCTIQALESGEVKRGL